jgi:hypothetical protein
MPQVWAELERDYVKFLRELREAILCFGADRVEQDVRDIIKGQQGNTPDEELNGLLLAEYDARAVKGEVELAELVREFREKPPKLLRKYLRTVKDDSVRRRMARLLEAREQEDKEKAALDLMRRPSLVGGRTE